MEGCHVHVCSACTELYEITAAKRQVYDLLTLLFVIWLVVVLVVELAVTVVFPVV